MTILIAIPCLLRGGTEMQTLNLVKVLAEAGYHVITLCYFEYDSAVVNEFRQAGSQVQLMQLQRSIKAFKLIGGLYKQIKMLQPDVVHVQYMAPGALPIISARLAGVKKMLATVHQPFTPAHGRLAKPLLGLSAFLCSRFIAVSKNAEISWFGNGQLYNEQIPLSKQPKHFTIYNAVDVDRLQKIAAKVHVPIQKQALGIAPHTVVVGAVSRLRHEKGIDLLIQGFALAAKGNPDIHLLLVGTGPDALLLKNLAGDLGVSKQCTFYGEAEWNRAMQLMAVMDVVVVPSRFEGFGLTAAEAMAMGKTVIASDVFGLQEVVVINKTGYLVPLEGTDIMAQKIQCLIEDLQLRSTMGTAGKHYAKTHFDIPVFNQKTRSLYQQILAD